MDLSGSLVDRRFLKVFIAPPNRGVIDTEIPQKGTGVIESGKRNVTPNLSTP
jgi:hypothetical protein